MNEDIVELRNGLVYDRGNSERAGECHMLPCSCVACYHCANSRSANCGYHHYRHSFGTAKLLYDDCVNCIICYNTLLCASVVLGCGKFLSRRRHISMKLMGRPCSLPSLLAIDHRTRNLNGSLLHSFLSTETNLSCVETSKTAIGSGGCGSPAC